MHQAINVDGTANQFVITIHFSPKPVTTQNQPTNEVPEGKLLVRINDAAKRLSLSRTNLYKLLMNGELESIKVGRSRLIPIDALQAFVERHRSKQND
jgi:excisionase family DNA binding protein